MAQVTLQYQIDDEECITVSLALDAEHPDALDELSTRAVKILRDSLIEIYAINRATDNPDAEPEATA